MYPDCAVHSWSCSGGSAGILSLSGAEHFWQRSLHRVKVWWKSLTPSTPVDGSFIVMPMAVLGNPLSLMHMECLLPNKHLSVKPTVWFVPPWIMASSIKKTMTYNIPQTHRHGKQCCCDNVLSLIMTQSQTRPFGGNNRLIHELSIPLPPQTCVLCPLCYMDLSYLSFKTLTLQLPCLKRSEDKLKTGDGTKSDKFFSCIHGVKLFNHFPFLFGLLCFVFYPPVTANQVSRDRPS